MSAGRSSCVSLEPLRETHRTANPPSLSAGPMVMWNGSMLRLIGGPRAGHCPAQYTIERRIA